MSTEVRYAVVQSRTRFDRRPSYFGGRGEKVYVGYDVLVITGHDADGPEVFLCLEPVGWSRTIEEARAMMQRHATVTPSEES